MCIICVKPKGINLPDKDLLDRCFTNNPNGVGFAIHKENQENVYIQKGFMKFDDFYNTLIQQDIQDNDEVIVHFRLATSGRVDSGNTHPFVITSKKLLLRETSCITHKTVMAHNGILSQFSDKSKKYSDTQLFITNILADKKVYAGLYTSKAIQRLLTDYISTDKLAFLNARQGILLIGEFIEYKGCLYSNSGYEYPRWRYYPALNYQSSFRRFKGNEKRYTTSDIPEDEFTDAYGFEKGTTQYSCDYCGKYKTVKWNEYIQSYLCKACRKLYKKGKLFV